MNDTEKSLKEQLEILRGESIQVFTGDPLDIPCIETSDAERLCKKPVVSVDMITYNHEPYIRQAIEGVMMQKTDFEFELVIGEDCSTDRTREICFEYQKRYPDKIRVLWCDHNLYRNPHPAGGNSARNRAHCRGEFIAFCEGDDYWTDPLKLQKQVDVMRKHPNVGLCFTNGRRFYQQSGKYKEYNYDHSIESGVKFGRDFAIAHMIVEEAPISSMLTASVLVRKSILSQVRKDEKIFSWRLHLGDRTTWIGLATRSDVYFIDDDTTVYRVHGCGVSNLNRFFIDQDGIIVSLYWLLRLGMSQYDSLLLRRLENIRFHCMIHESDCKKKCNYARKMLHDKNFHTISLCRRALVSLYASNEFAARCISFLVCCIWFSKYFLKGELKQNQMVVR